MLLVELSEGGEDAEKRRIEGAGLPLRPLRGGSGGQRLGVLGKSAGRLRLWRWTVGMTGRWAITGGPVELDGRRPSRVQRAPRSASVPSLATQAQPGSQDVEERKN